MSGYAKYRERRSSWGISVIGSLVVEIETEAGVTGVATHPRDCRTGPA